MNFEWLIRLEKRCINAVHLPFYDPIEGGVIRKPQELDRLMSGGAAVCIQGEEQRRKDAEGTWCWWPGRQRHVSQPHVLKPNVHFHHGHPVRFKLVQCELHWLL